MLNHKNMCVGKTKWKPNMTLRIKQRKIQLKYTDKNADTFTLLTYLYTFAHLNNSLIILKLVPMVLKYVCIF